MMDTEIIYRSILSHISNIPSDYLEQVNDYLQQLHAKIEAQKNENRAKILAFAGSWNDMSDTEFEEYLQSTKEVKNNMFLS